MNQGLLDIGEENPGQGMGSHQSGGMERDEWLTPPPYTVRAGSI